jgi:EmrB/QacA subfamily drug resistance transporter
MLILVAASLSQFMAFLDGTVVNLALATIQRELGAPMSALQWIVDGYVLMLAALMLSGGNLADRFGRRRCYLVGLGIFLFGSLMCAMAPTVNVLIAGRLTQGVGAAVFSPATLGLLSSAFPQPAQRARAIGLWSGAAGLSLAAGPVFGGLMISAFGWQSVFYLNVPLCAAAAVMALTVPESSDPEKPPVDIAGQVLAVVGLGALTFAVIEGSRIGWRSPLIVTLFVVAAVTLAAFVVTELRAPFPMLSLDLFRSRVFSACNAISFLNGFSLIGAFFFFSLFLQQVQGNDPLGAGVRMLPVVVALTVCAPLAGYLAPRVGPRPLVSAGMAVTGFALLAFVLVGADTGFGAWWPIPLAVGVGVGLSMTPITAAALDSLPAPRAGMASASIATSQQVGGVIGIAVMGVVVTGGAEGVLEEAFLVGAHRATVVCGVLCLLGAVVGLLFMPGRQRPPATGGKVVEDAGDSSDEQLPLSL